MHSVYTGEEVEKQILHIYKFKICITWYAHIWEGTDAGSNIQYIY